MKSYKSLLSRVTNGIGWTIVLLWLFEFLFSTVFGMFLVFSMLWWLFIGLLGGAVINMLSELPVSGEPWFLCVSGIIALILGFVSARQTCVPPPTVPPDDD